MASAAFQANAQPRRRRGDDDGDLFYYLLHSKSEGGGVIEVINDKGEEEIARKGHENEDEEQLLTETECPTSGDEESGRRLSTDKRPDDDSLSSSSSSSSSTSDSDVQSALKWSLASNMHFFLGSVMYTCLAIWDLRDAYIDEASESSDSSSPSDDSTQSGTSMSIAAWDGYTWLSAFAALSYVVNAIVDLLWATHDFQYETSNIVGDNLALGVKMGRYGDARTDVAVAVTFGIAASFEMFATFLQSDPNPSHEALAYMAAAHVYLLNAILALAGRTFTFASLSKVLEETGDILFLIGSVIDVILSYLNDPDVLRMSLVKLGWGNLLSAVLWLVDSVLYLLSNYIEFRKLSKKILFYGENVTIRIPLLIEAARVDEESSHQS